jgi:hypothetical protein
MTAFLGQQLIFYVDGRGARILEASHHVHDIQRFAIAGVTVDSSGSPDARAT